MSTPTSVATPLVVHAPAHAGPGFAWVARVLLGRFLGLGADAWRLAEAPARGFSIQGPAGRIAWPDIFFAAQRHGQPAAGALPTLPLPQWALPDEALVATLGESRLPLLHAGTLPGADDSVLCLPFDLFGACFFMLSRYEEWADAVPVAPRDRHGRFPAAASIAQRGGVLHRPLVDEYTEVLWWALSRIAPGLVRAPRRARLWLSCDVDAPYTPGAAPGARGLHHALRQAGSHLLNDRSAALAARSLLAAATAPFGSTRFDPFDTFDLLLDRLDAAGQRATFYMIAADRPRGPDGVYTLAEPRIARLLRRLVARGHEIGLHGSYHSADDPALLAAEAQRLRAAVAGAGAGGGQDSWPARQHYLRWVTPRTARHLAAAGFASDSTLAFAETPGFRCGTCHAYPMWDLEQQRELPLLERPLVAMDASVTSRSYLGLGFGEAAFEAFDRVARSCRRFGGEFSLLWHNSNLALPGARPLFDRLLGAWGR
jgi:peptidoglycan/xylan/chitin deacetylase (PgdA/CDA1 family)